MRLNNCVTKYKKTGPCEIDIEKAIRTFTKRCFISKWKSPLSENYRLCRITYKKTMSMKVIIDSKVADTLIRELDLVEYGSGVFNSGSIFVMKGVSPLKV